MTTLEKTIKIIDKWKPTDYDFPGHKGHDGKFFSQTLKSDSLMKCPECFYALKKQVFEGKERNPENPQKPQEIILLLRSCMSTENDFVFVQLLPYKVEREEIVENIFKKFILPDDGALASAITPQSRQYYRLKIFEWFIGRYSWKNARMALKGAKLPWPVFLNLIYLRMVVGIMIGFLALLTADKIWDVPATLGVTQQIIYVAASLFLVWLYILYECYSLVKDKAKAAMRSLGALLLGCLFSLGIFFFAYWLLSDVYVPHEAKNFCDQAYLFWERAVFFCPAALLVGVFLQFVWEDKTIAEPL